MTAHTRTVASLFSGAGGFDWGFHRAGFKTQLAVELEESPAKTLAHNLELKTLTTPIAPTLDQLPVVIQGDVREVDFSALVSMPLDVLIGGPPCQDFSLSKGSKREGLNGKRGKLYLEFLRALIFLQPKMFVFENVPGFMSANGGSAYQTVQDYLQQLDQHHCEILEATNFVVAPQSPIFSYHILFNNIVDVPVIGVSQTRRRLIIVGIRKNLIESSVKPALSDLITRELDGSHSKFSRYPLTTLEIFEGQALDKLDAKYKQVMDAYRDLGLHKPFAQADAWRKNVLSKLHLDVIKDYYAACGLNYEQDYNPDEFMYAMDEHRALLDLLGFNKPVYELKDVHNTQLRQSQEVQARMYQIPPGENAEFVDDTEWSVTNKKISFIYRRALPLKPAWTVMAYGGGGTYGYHYERDRQILTLRERARIQTFSDDFEFQGTSVRAQIGEAVPPLLGERIACAVKAILDQVSPPLEQSRLIHIPQVVVCPSRAFSAQVVIPNLSI